jgi:hypothetical protein
MDQPWTVTNVDGGPLVIRMANGKEPWLVVGESKEVIPIPLPGSIVIDGRVITEEDALYRMAREMAETSEGDGWARLTGDERRFWLRLAVHAYDALRANPKAVRCDG